VGVYCVAWVTQAVNVYFEVGSFVMKTADFLRGLTNKEQVGAEKEGSAN
jgi:hypothetical protein